jgi:hypothetical protein
MTWSVGTCQPSLTHKELAALMLVLDQADSAGAT